MHQKIGQNIIKLMLILLLFLIKKSKKNVQYQQRALQKPNIVRLFKKVIILNQKLSLMCFIKKQEIGQIPIYQPCGNNCQCSNVLQSLNNTILPYYNASFIWNNPISQNLCPIHKVFQQVQMVCNILQSNNQIIHASFEKLEKNQKELIFLDNEIDRILDKQVDDSSAGDQEVEKYMHENIFFSSNSPIILKLFGRQQYRFRIKAIPDLPKTIYKQRNLHIPLQLTTKQGKPVKNGNLIHLCIAVCDQQGKWIVDQNDEFFIQGKIEVDLYRGQCQFKKIYPKDISRHFPGGKINVIIYSKPSILVPNNALGKGQHMINYEEIQPLLFSNILIKAKKKLRY